MVCWGWRVCSNVLHLPKHTRMNLARKYASVTEVKSHNTDSFHHESHVPVLVSEVLKMMSPKEDEIYVDMTFGAGGHSKALLEAEPDIKLFALDRDPDAYNLALQLGQEYSQLTPLLGRFSDLPKLLETHGVCESSVSGVLLDAGVCSAQFDTPTRGFSISNDGPLDMRMDKDRFPKAPSAADVVNNLSEEDLTEVLKRYGEESKARLIARAIVDHRQAYGAIHSTKKLATVIEAVFVGPDQREKHFRHSHVATRTFQALRIFVNNELNELSAGLQGAQRYLRLGGVCCVISFHSLEDRIVKRHFCDVLPVSDVYDVTRASVKRQSFSLHELQRATQRCWSVINKRVLTPSDSELKINPRCRSAKLRAAVKIRETT